METKEKNLEQDIESWLLSEGGYVKGTMDTYDKKRAIDMPILIKFIETTQPKQWERYKTLRRTAYHRLLPRRQVFSNRLVNCLEAGEDRGAERIKKRHL